MENQENTVKKIVAEAMHFLSDKDGWNPSVFGEYERGGEHTVQVTFFPPTRFCTKPAYRLHGVLFGVWVGYLNQGRIGKPMQNHTAEQVTHG